MDHSSLSRRPSIRRATRRSRAPFISGFSRHSSRGFSGAFSRRSRLTRAVVFVALVFLCSELTSGVGDGRTASAGPTTQVSDPTVACVTDCIDWVMPDHTTTESIKTDSVVFQSDFNATITLTSSLCAPTKKVDWYVGNVKKATTNGCQWFATFANEGKYVVRADVAGSTKVFERDVVIQDFIIGVLGDSNASGEGNPVVKGRNPTWRNTDCHRSENSGLAQAAIEMEKASAHSSVTLIHLACSGAKITRGLLEPYDGLFADGGDHDPQVQELRSRAGNREIDATLVSVGINDLDPNGFSRIITKCFALPRCELPLADQLGETLSLLGVTKATLEGFGFEGSSEEAVTKGLVLLPGKYNQLATALEQRLISANRVFLTEYPDLSTKRGGTCTALLTENPELLNAAAVIPGPVGTIAAAGNVANMLLIEDEFRWLGEAARQLNSRVRGAANRNGWQSIRLPASGFAERGYCEVPNRRNVVTLLDSFVGQGDHNGAFHPNARGHSVTKTQALAALKRTLLPAGLPVLPITGEAPDAQTRVIPKKTTGPPPTKPPKPPAPTNPCSIPTAGGGRSFATQVTRPNCITECFEPASADLTLDAVWEPRSGPAPFADKDGKRPNIQAVVSFPLPPTETLAAVPYPGASQSQILFPPKGFSFPEITHEPSQPSPDPNDPPSEDRYIGRAKEKPDTQFADIFIRQSLINPASASGPGWYVNDVQTSELTTGSGTYYVYFTGAASGITKPSFILGHVGNDSTLDALASFDPNVSIQPTNFELARLGRQLAVVLNANATTDNWSLEDGTAIDWAAAHALAKSKQAVYVRTDLVYKSTPLPPAYRVSIDGVSLGPANAKNKIVKTSTHWVAASVDRGRGIDEIEIYILENAAAADFPKVLTFDTGQLPTCNVTDRIDFNIEPIAPCRGEVRVVDFKSNRAGSVIDGKTGVRYLVVFRNDIGAGQISNLRYPEPNQSPPLAMSIDGTAIPPLAARGVGIEKKSANGILLWRTVRVENGFLYVEVYDALKGPTSLQVTTATKCQFSINYP
jgi:hypothetical protein